MSLSFATPMGNPVAKRRRWRARSGAEAARCSVAAGWGRREAPELAAGAPDSAKGRGAAGLERREQAAERLAARRPGAEIGQHSNHQPTPQLRREPQRIEDGAVD